ncbi:MAG: pyrophosphatase [Idiomarina sp.]|nr:nucleoside triphosphate pyrophosphohydrolase family protein [Idiomarina sp.]PHQ76985.1 MAG: pyrophosphatase [Idiomarina sp.]
MPKKIEVLEGLLPLSEYEDLARQTDRFPDDDLVPILLGLYGEIGSVMSATKKYRREKKAYIGYKDAVEEEFGDALWYFTAICKRFKHNISDIFSSAFNANDFSTLSAGIDENSPLSQTISSSQVDSLDNTLIELGCITAELLKLKKNSENSRELLVKFARLYIQSIQTVRLSFASIARTNLEKAQGRFKVPDIEELPDFDQLFPEEEQLPIKFEIEIAQRKSGQSYLKWNGVFIGSPLTDNMLDKDGYRFHDVFHLAHAAILHWSPTVRALIKHKRKSDPVFDEAQDSGRAIVVEEGLTAWLYSTAKGLDYFKGHDSVSFDILKTIQKFVSGYEVESCPLKLWEQAILQGYEVFREVRKNEGGIIVGDRTTRTLSYRPLGASK